MDRNELISFGKAIKALYHTINDQQLGLVVDWAQHVPLEAAQAALKAHAGKYQYIDLPQFKEGLRAANDTRAAHGAAGWNDSERKAIPMAPRRQLEGTTALVSGTDEELEAEKEAVIAELPEASRPFLLKSDPKKNRILAALIQERRRRLAGVTG